MPIENYEVMLARWKWLLSQQRWHGRRLRHKNKKWHMSQYRWYRNQIRKYLTFSFIVSHTIRKNGSKIAENICANNAILKRLTNANR